MAKFSAIRPTERAVLAMKPDATTVTDIPKFLPKDGVAFYITARLGTLLVAGGVYKASAFRYQPDKQVGAYLNGASGASREVGPRRIFVIRADGTVISRPFRDKHFHDDFAKIRMLPGDAFIVPEKLRGSSKMNDFLQVTQFVSQTALTAAAFSVIQ
jgi:hypothetical protein